jgi:ATP-binding cassette subfamily B protein/subfamily B ATP-binding cassette protein MsbA
MSSSQTSRRRYMEYLERRRKAAADRAGGDAGPAGPSEEDGPKKPKRNRTFGQLFRAFWGMVRVHRVLVIAALVTLTVQALLALLFPAGTKIAIDYLITDHPGPSGIPRWAPLPESARDPANRVRMLWVLGAVLIALTVSRIAVGMWGRWQMTRLTKRTQMSLRRRVFDHAIRLPLHRVHQIKSGGVASILREDAGGSAELLFHLFYNPWNAIVQLTGTLIILTVVDWRMLAGAAVLIPVVAYMHRLWIRRIRPLYRDIKVSRTAIDAHATEAFGGIRVVRGFDRSKGEAGRFSRGVHFMTRQEIHTWWWSRGVDIAWALMIPVATTSVLIYGGTQIIHGRMTVGDMVMFTTYLMMLLGPLEVLASSASDMQTNLAAFDRVLDVLAEPAEFHDTRGEVEVSRSSARGRINLRNVWFRYTSLSGDKDKPAELLPPVIRDVSLDVQPGETIALVGPSGSGKTTLCNLIARFYDPTQGVIEFDGIDLRRIRVDSYRRLLGIVEQDVFLFDGTIAENIGYGRRDATPAQIAEAARTANAAEFIEKLERGYDTLIGERGVRLSGGQKQRLAIARAILADPLILILDEATSNLDTESERLIQRSLTRLMRGRTCFVIAHRLSTIRHASRIAVIEDGRIIEVGTHDELLAGGGRYAEFLRVQVEGQKAADAEAALPADAR